jgi:hypothetical protein
MDPAVKNVIEDVLAPPMHSAATGASTSNVFRTELDAADVQSLHSSSPARSAS